MGRWEFRTAPRASGGISPSQGRRHCCGGNASVVGGQECDRDDSDCHGSGWQSRGLRPYRQPRPAGREYHGDVFHERRGRRQTARAAQGNPSQDLPSGRPVESCQSRLPGYPAKRDRGRGPGIGRAASLPGGARSRRDRARLRGNGERAHQGTPRPKRSGVYLSPKTDRRPCSQATPPDRKRDKEYVEAGCLMSYGPSFPDMYRRAATMWTRFSKAPSPRTFPWSDRRSSNWSSISRPLSRSGLRFRSPCCIGRIE